jgi:transglutaminase-like putative cysteine protease
LASVPQLLARVVAPLAAAAALIAVAWLSLEGDVASWGDLALVLALALAPVLAVVLSRRWWVGVLVLLVGFIPAAAVTLGVPLTRMRPGDPDFFGPAWDAVVAGLQDFYELQLPFDPGLHPESAGLVLIAIYGFVAACGVLLAAGRPLLAAITLVIGVGWPVTPAAAAGAIGPLTVGALVLAALLAFLFLTRTDRRPLRGLAPAGVLGALVVLVAVGASTSGAVAKDAFLGWTKWDPYNAPTEPVGVRYVWTSNYRGITFPEEETVVLRIKAPERSFYWRATTLDEYTGVGWREALDPGPPVPAQELLRPPVDPLLPGAAREQRNWTRQDVTVLGLADTHLIAAAQPVRWSAIGQGPLQYASGGVVLAPQGLKRDQTYTVWSYAPRVRPKELAALEADYPPEVLRYLEVVPDVRFPEFGVENRDEIVEALFDGRADDALLAQYEPVYREAREVAGEAASPYLAAVSVEAWLRTEGGFRYEEKPVQALGAEPPLVDFVLRSREGYCQHFAGAMAVMLRLLGIPSRVAVGFTSGDYDERLGEYTVTDHNAHAWVEVYFPGKGWLPFDPTPGRGELGAAYSTASTQFPTGVGSRNALGVGPDALSAILRQRLEGVEGGPSAPGGAGATAGSSAVDEGGGIGVPALVFIVLAAAIALLLGGKAVRRALRFRSHDPRRIASACRRDLVAFLADQGVTVSESATLEEVGAFVEREFRVNAMPFVRAAEAARFGPPAEASDAARRARRELKTLLGSLRRQLGTASRVRGALRLRSLTV